jgi:hypothetical protein
MVAAGRATGCCPVKSWHVEQVHEWAAAAGYPPQSHTASSPIAEPRSLSRERGSLCRIFYFQAGSFPSPPISRVISSIRSKGNGGKLRGLMTMDMSFIGLSWHSRGGV